MVSFCQVVWFWRERSEIWVYNFLFSNHFLECHVLPFFDTYAVFWLKSHQIFPFMPWTRKSTLPDLYATWLSTNFHIVPFLKSIWGCTNTLFMMGDPSGPWYLSVQHDTHFPLKGSHYTSTVSTWRPHKRHNLLHHPWNWHPYLWCALSTFSLWHIFQHIPVFNDTVLSLCCHLHFDLKLTTLCYLAVIHCRLQQKGHADVLLWLPP